MKPGAQIYYRIVHSNPPTLEDFYSHDQLGKPCHDYQNLGICSGISVNELLTEAHQKAASYRGLGNWIATIAIDPSLVTFRVARTGRQRERHFTIWADPEALRACVIKVEPVCKG